MTMLTMLNLTVSNGAINGIVFYANMIQANQALFYTQNNHISSILRYFIAWLNLDIGIEICNLAFMMVLMLMPWLGSSLFFLSMFGQ